MPLEFIRVSKEQPCPICGRPDYCELGAKAVLCQRVSSNRPNTHQAGGWYHFYEDGNAYRPDLNKSLARPKPILKNADNLIESLRYLTTEKQYQQLGYELNIQVDALKATGCAWFANYNAWCWPMYDGSLNVIGLRLRNSQGFKWAVPGSNNGVFLNLDAMYDEHLDSKCVFITEGPSDTASLLALGFTTIGRPTCATGFEIIKELLGKIGTYKVVIVADNDDLKQAGNRQFRPGIESAQKLKQFLGIKSCVWLPPSPCKDVRDFVREGGTRELILQNLKTKVWDK